MVRACVFPSCPNKMTSWTKFSFHGLPFRDPNLLKLWLIALKIDLKTEVVALKRADYRVCGAHFALEDFFPQKAQKEGQKTRRLILRKNAVPMVAEGTTDTLEELQKKDATCQRSAQTRLTKSENKENRVKEDEDEEFNTSLSVGDGRYMVDLGSSSELIVDEECILELFKSCRKCNRQCTVRKHVTGLKLIVNQTCCFCQHHFQWTNLSDEDYDKDNSDSQINGQNSAMSPSSNTS